MVAAQRQGRPNMPEGWCPFCPGSGRVPEAYEVLKYDNDYPVLTQETLQPLDDGGFFKRQGAYGKCEVILYHSDHTVTLPELPLVHIRKLVDLWCNRVEELKRDKNIRYIYIFENRGREAGVTMPHPHGQLYAFGWVPQTIQLELESSKEHFKLTGRCLMCELLENEQGEGSRLVYENASFSIFVPFFTAWPYGVYLVPKAHLGDLTDLSNDQKDGLADALKVLTGAYDTLFGRPFPYMMGIHQTPVNSEDSSRYYHMHFEFYPPLRATDKQYFRASCETGAGAYCNVTLPEETAEELRQAVAKFISKGVLNWNIQH